MKIALVTTTIHVPNVLCLYCAYGPDVQFFVIGDKKTPHAEVDDLCRSLGNATYYSPELQQELDYACSELIGWSSIQRRNIGFLEALKWGADLIVSVDDDNIPMDSRYFYEQFAGLFFAVAAKPTTRLWSGLQLSNHDIEPESWFDPGQLLIPPVRHRGLPISSTSTSTSTSTNSGCQVSFATSVKIGVAAGLWCGDPDVSAVDRIATRPEVTSVSELARSGFVVELTTPTVWNSQNTAIIRELVPAWMMLPGIGRMDDIFASLICRRIMREHDLYVHYGQPFVYQQRNDHNLVNDLKAEVFGMEHVQQFYDWLENLELGDPESDTLDHLRHMYQDMQAGLKWMPSQVSETGLAWIEDCRKVMT